MADRYVQIPVISLENTLLTNAMPRFILLLIYLFFASGVTLQARHLTGHVMDAKSHEHLVGVTVELLSVKDSSLIRAAVTVEKEHWGIKMAQYNIDVENNTGYLLRFSMLGYKTQYRRIDVKMAERVNTQYVDEVLMESDSKLLDEVVVKATKIKMVMKGDTVVYDATAFKMSEGSMLDALIRQMPGASLEDGVIKVNGRTVSALLIDGRDFFRGDAKKALDNLPAYTVDKIKVYDKQGRTSRLMGRDMNDKEFVLDVGLKKQYMHGLMGNTDVAIGTDHRYGAKMFAMGYTRRSRLTVTGMMNNVNDWSVPGENGSEQRMPEGGGGLQAMKSIGVDYRHEGTTEDDYVETSNALNYSDGETLTKTTSQTFLTGGDYYGLSRSGNRAKNTTWATRNTFSLTPGKHSIFGELSVNYSNQEGWGSSRSGRFSGNPGTMSLLDSLFSMRAGQRLLAMTVNRVRNDNMSHGRSVSYNASLSERFAFGKDKSYNNVLAVHGGFQYTHGKHHRYALQQIDYLGNAPGQDHRNQYSCTPNENYNAYLNMDYSRVIDLDSAKMTSIFLRPTYRFEHRYSDDDYSLYRLDRLSDYTDEAYALGVLPSTREALMQVLDSHNSYRNRERTVSNAGGLDIVFQRGNGTQMPRISATLSLPVEARYEKLDYYRERSYLKDRRSVFFNPSLRCDYQFNDSTGMRYAAFNYSSSEREPSLSSLLDIRDDANPLTITLGNPNLKKARTHSAYLTFVLFNMETQGHFSVSTNYSVVQDAIATSVLYDKETGKTTSQQVNVNGNWNLSGNVRWVRAMDKARRLSFDGDIGASYGNSVDLTTVAGTQSTRSHVHNWFLRNNLALKYQLDSRLNVFLRTNVSYERATSKRPDFQTVGAWNLSLSIGGSAELPWGFQLSTDCTAYGRRGYNDEQMNTSELVWNARLTKKMLRDKLSVSLDGFDILGHLNSTSFTLNSQGRTETWTSGLTRHLMLHVAYKFTMGMQSVHRARPFILSE